MAVYTNAGGGGGVSSDELTAARGDVLKGKTAVTSDSNDEPVEGTLELIGDAADSHVLTGKTYYNKDPKTRRTGTMPNRGAVAQELAAGVSYTIPEGYHNGGGKVTAKSLASPQAAAEEEKPEAQEEIIDRITVKDGSRIHIIKVDELLYIQACGDYATLVTPTGEYIKEQTMKYFEGHLPTNNFVRIHRSTIVNVTQISRVELFGKETYQVLLKNGTKLRVSLTGYRLLKERLGI